jgi:phospholipid transport system substrate-binding protein
MIRRRLLLAAALAAAAALPLGPARAQSLPTPAPGPAAVSSFYDTLLAVMKEGPALGFKGRTDRLGPTIRRSFDFALMTRLMVGQPWQSLTPEQQQQLVAAFSDFSVAIYASRFDEYSGEHFEVDPSPTPTTGGVVVRTKLVKSDAEPVELDYLMHQANGLWQIVDVYLSGTVSELATRRSEFSSVMRQGGANALVDLLQKKAAELRG